MIQYITLHRENPYISTQKHTNSKSLPFPQMKSPVGDLWVLSERDEGQQAGFLLLLGCCSSWETGICAWLVSKQAVVKKQQTHHPILFFSPSPLGQFTRLWSFASQWVLVCCDSWQCIPVGKWWTGSGESKINYEVGEISAHQITVQWFHWNGSVWQCSQTHRAGQNTQMLLCEIAACTEEREFWLQKWVQGGREQEGIFKIGVPESLVLCECKHQSQGWVCYLCCSGKKSIFRIPQLSSADCIIKTAAHRKDSVFTSVSSSYMNDSAPGNTNG